MEHTEKLSLTSAILMNINLMVGASAFMAPEIMTAYAGPASFYGWLLAGALFLPVVWCVAQMTAYFPGQGSFYSYASKTISREAGFISGWVYFLGYVSIGALQLMSLTRILAHHFNIPILSSHPALCGSMLVVLLGALSLRPLGVIDRIQSMATLYKLTPLLIGITSLLFFFSPSKTAAITSLSPATLIPTIPMAIFGFWGFEGVCSISHLIKDSARNARRAIFLGFFSTVLIYALFHLSLLAVMGAEALQTQGAVSFVAYMGLTNSTLIALLKAIVTSAIVIAHVNAIFGGIVANSAMLCAMAEEKMVFLSALFSTRMSGTQRPVGTVIAHCAGLVFCITVVASINTLNAMANIGVLLAFLLTTVALRIRSKARLAPFLGALSCAILARYSWQVIGSTDYERGLALLPLAAAVLIGYVLYYAEKRCRTKENC